MSDKPMDVAALDLERDVVYRLVVDRGAGRRTEIYVSAPNDDGATLIRVYRIEGDMPVRLEIP